jgi:subtilase family serine protease
MMLHRVLRFICGSCLCILGLLVVSQSALGARTHHAMSPLVIVGPQAIPATSGPQYGLFRCQVGTDPRGRTCYDPYQIRRAYQVDSQIAAGYDGTGYTIVIIDAFQNPNLVSQVAAYNAFYGLPSTNLTQIAPDGLTPFVPGDPNMTGWAEEISLDVEWAHNIAPGAKIVLVLAKSNQDADIQSALNYAVTNNLGDVISMSFGENESCTDPSILSAEHDSFEAATQNGVTLFASSGDQGAAQMTCDGTSWVRAVSSPASDPLVTAVGGTELHAAGYCLTALGCDPSTNPSPGTYQGEITWNEGPPFGDFQALLPPPSGSASDGGGFSVLYPEPPYQQGTGGLRGGKQRAVPDVAYNAAIYHGVLTYLNIPGVPAGFYLFGGTSCGSPQWAGITAIADQKAGKRLGFLNTALYHIGTVNQAYPASFNDVTRGVNSVVEYDVKNNPITVAGFSAGAGWDPTTGTGTPIDPGLVDYLLTYVSPGDGTAAIANSQPKSHPKPISGSGKNPH